MNLLDRLIQRAREFPTLPTVYTALTEVMANPRSTAADIANVVSQDQSSVSKVLRVANSAMYGFVGRVDTITNAVFLIGFNEVKNLIAALSIINMFSKSQSLVMAFNPMDLWKHSVGVGVASRLIAKEAGIVALENYFIAGILHDIGKLLFYEYAEKEYVTALEYATMNGVSIIEAEKKTLGMDHTLAGELLAARWKLPPDIRNVIRFHHTGIAETGDSKIVACVHLANIVARALDLGFSGDKIVPAPNPDVWDILKLPQDTFTNLLPHITVSYDETVRKILS